MYFAAKHGHIDDVKAFTMYNTDVNLHVSDEFDKTPLHVAAENGHNEVVKHLVKKGADVNAKDEDNWTPIHYAVMNGHNEVVQLLIEKEADVNAKDNNTVFLRV